MTIVCIAGMHRSGTSMVSHILNLCGVDLGETEDLIPPAPDNTEGFWENTKFVSINDKLLVGTRGGWDAPPPFEAGWEESAKLASLYDQAGRLIEEFNKRSQAWGWKDPRNSLTLPFWKRLIPNLKVIVCLRNPLEVASSLTRRGFNSTIFGIKLWHTYNSSVLSSISPENCMVTHYDSFFIDPEAELRRLLTFIEISANDSAIRDACNSTITSLRHNWSTFNNLLALEEQGFEEIVGLYERMCIEAGSTYWASFFEDVQRNNSSTVVPAILAPAQSRILVGLAENNHALLFSLREKDNALREKDNALQEKDILLRQKDNALQEKDYFYNLQLQNVLNSRSWRFIQFFQRQRLKVMPPGSLPDRTLHLISKVVRTLRRDGVNGLLRVIRNRYAWRNPAFATLTEVPILRDLPKVSIVIPVFNGISLTRECIQSVYKNCDSCSFEILVIDNASKDGTPRWLNAKKGKHSNLDVITMGENIGFGPAVNVGIRRSRGEFIVILNNDTIVAPGWLDNLLSAIQKDPSIGIVSPVTNYVGEGPQIDEDAKDLQPTPDVIERYARSIADRAELVNEPNRLVFFCVMMRRELVDLIGYLDEGYEKGNFEDDDYCLRTRMAGYKLTIVRNSFVYHHGSATFTKNRISHSEYMELNRERFYKKTGRIASSSCHFSNMAAEKNAVDVSIIVRTKDRPILLKRALTSLANQTFRKFEVVLINDAGEDVSLLKEHFDAYFPISYIYNTVGVGRTAAVNQGINKACGRWIGILDDDDILYPWHLESLLLVAQQRNHKFVYSDYNRALFAEAARITPDILVGAPPRDYSQRELLVQNYIPIHTWLFAHECFEKVGEWRNELDRLEDYEFLLRLSSSYDFYHYKKVTCEYRYYLDSVNSIYTDRQKSLDALQQIYRLYPVQEQELISQRHEVLEQVEAQIKKIKDLKQKSGKSISEAVATREIVRLVVGI